MQVDVQQEKMIFPFNLNTGSVSATKCGESDIVHSAPMDGEEVESQMQGSQPESNIGSNEPIEKFLREAKFDATINGFLTKGDLERALLLKGTSQSRLFKKLQSGPPNNVEP